LVPFDLKPDGANDGQIRAVLNSCGRRQAIPDCKYINNLFTGLLLASNFAGALRNPVLEFVIV
jgi:DNA-binding helix-hairpin-helix protein with protein kinase domain